MEDPTEVKGHESANREPLGFGEHTRRNSSERAHEQGWGLNEEERRQLPRQKQDYAGGTDYEYGAQDFGDTPVDTSAAKPAVSTLEVQKRGATPEKKRSGERKAGSQRTSARRG
jgi:hypothetical protein